MIFKVFQRPSDRYGEKPYQTKRTERKLATSQTATALGFATHYYKSGGCLTCYKTGPLMTGVVKKPDRCALAQL